MTRYMLLATVAVAASLPLSAAAQSMDPGMHMPMPAPKPTSKPATKPAPMATRPAARRAPVRHASPAAHSDAPAPMAPLPPADDMPGMAPATPTPSAPPRTLPAPMAGMAMPMLPASDGTTPPSPAMPAERRVTAPMAPEMAGMAMTGGSAYVTGSGTSRLPANEGAMQGLHFGAGAWMMMLHGYAWDVYTDQGGPRGANEGYVQSMAMLSASHDLGSGARVELRSMLSLEPLMGPRGYPNLFATGESADGVSPLIDRQHPHDLFMELSGRIDVDIAPETSLFVYGGPVAEPALGPSAFMHRASAQYLPDSPITHHWFDSTHISFGVVTTGIATTHWQIEGSAFRGREPDQHRWDIETPKLDSWSVRATWTPSPGWAVQVSHGYIHSGEQLEPGVNEARTTASVQYATGGLSTTFGFSIKDKQPGRALTAWLAEANWDLDGHHILFARAENVANDELFANPADPLHDTTFRVSKFEGGYAYRLKIAGPVQAALGGSLGVYAKPAALDGAFGKFPVSFSLFAKLSLGH
jgi:hypothetical protein